MHLLEIVICGMCANNSTACTPVLCNVVVILARDLGIQIKYLLVLMKQFCLELLHSKTEGSTVCVIAKEKQIVGKTASVELIKWKWQTKLIIQKHLNLSYSWKWFEIEKVNGKCLLIQQIHKKRGVCRRDCASQYQVEIHAAAAVTVSNISSKLLISRRWQLVSSHFSKILRTYQVWTHTHS